MSLRDVALKFSVRTPRQYTVNTDTVYALHQCSCSKKAFDWINYIFHNSRVLSRVFEGKNLPPVCPDPLPLPLKKKIIVIITVTVSEKSSRRDEVSAHTVTVLKILSQNSPVASQHIFKSGGGMSPDLPRKFVPLGH